MRGQVVMWREQKLSSAAAKLTVYGAFIQRDLDIPKHLARRVDEWYFDPRLSAAKLESYYGASGIRHDCHTRRKAFGGTRYRSRARRDQ
jgi:hypothetical protein